MPRSGHDSRHHAVAVGVAIATIAAVTSIVVVLRLNAASAGLIFLLVVLLLASRLGLVAGLTASIVATLCFNYFFFPPAGTFSITDPANWVAVFCFFAASIVASRLLTRTLQKTEEAESSRRDLQLLYDLSVDLFFATNRLDALESSTVRVLETVGAASGGLILFEGSPNRQTTVAWIGAAQTDEVEDVVAGVARHRRSVDLPSRFGRDVYLPLILGNRAIGALVVRGTSARMPVLDSVARLVVLAIERERFVNEMAHVEALKESEQIKTSLLRAVSHDLNSPLTAISMEVEMLRQASLPPGAAIHAREAALHLSALRRRIQNLLYAARLEAGKAVPRPEPTPPADLLRSARVNLPAIHDVRRFEVEIDPECPDAMVDPSIALEMLVNLIENAHNASPPDQPITLRASVNPEAPDYVRFEVLDRGPGIDEKSLAAGTSRTTPGVSAGRGLGLEIVRSLAKLSGGELEFRPRDGGGTIAGIDIPAAGGD